MNSNINSFAEHMSVLTQNTKDILEIAQGINEAVSGNETEVNVNDTIILPSFTNVVKRVERAENTIAKFTQGKGVVETDDGTYRHIKVSTISTPPAKIMNIADASTFGNNRNWFFENLQWPRCIVNIDLKSQIDDESDRVYVKRVIIDTTNIADVIESTLGDIQTNRYTFPQLEEYLEQKNIEYYEDEDEVRLPLTYEKYDGHFNVLGTALLKNMKGVSQLWYYLDDIKYAEIDENGTVLTDTHVLSLNDRLRFKNSLYKIIEIDQTEKRVRLEYAVGYETIGTYDTLEYYNEPFSEKIISIGIGIDEINVVYVKGVNEDYNLLSKEWSDPIAFYTNALRDESNPDISFAKYYSEIVVDFGKDWIAQAKEGRKNAYNGKRPNAPTINGADLRVVQINTQLNATLDSERYNNITSEIASVKSNITAIRNTISVNKERMLHFTNESARNDCQKTIDSDTNTLNTLTTQFSSLVNELNTLLTDTGAIGYTPKYHVRGFFAIPEPQYGYIDPITGEKFDKQTIVGFETMYRYLHTDETGVALETFEYTNGNASDNAVRERGVFTDWNLKVSSFLEKKYDADSGLFIWSDESVDGTQVNINQVDIPIRRGEKVELRVRSISECGYPYNPLKSEWSDAVIISFPDNLTTDDSATTILNTVKNDMTSVVLQETLSSAGMYTHISDNNSIYKHSAENIEYTEKVTTSDGETIVTTMSIYDKIKALENLILGADNNDDTISLEITDASTGARTIRTLRKGSRTLDASSLLTFEAIDKTLRTTVR